MKNEPNNKVCEIIQLSMSDKLDESVALDHSEKEHLECCSDCQQFHQFIHEDTIQQIAHAPAGNIFDIEKISQTVAIMEMLTKNEPVKKTNNLIRFTIGGAAVAAIAAVTAVSISQSVQPSLEKSDSSAVTQEVAHNGKKIELPILRMPNINLNEKYSAINTVVVNRIESVSYSIKKLKACFIEGNAFLDEHTQSEIEGGPESLYFVMNEQVNIC